jgi:hypothetical protein
MATAINGKGAAKMKIRAWTGAVMVGSRPNFELLELPLSTFREWALS